MMQSSSYLEIFYWNKNTFELSLIDVVDHTNLNTYKMTIK